MLLGAAGSLAQQDSGPRAWRLPGLSRKEASLPSELVAPVIANGASAGISGHQTEADGVDLPYLAVTSHQQPSAVRGDSGSCATRTAAIDQRFAESHVSAGLGATDTPPRGLTTDVPTRLSVDSRSALPSVAGRLRLPPSPERN